MLGNLGNFASLLGQARNLGGKLNQVTEEMKSKQVTGEAGSGLVSVVANGLGQVLRVEIDPILRDKGDLEMMADLLPAAINDAIQKSKSLYAAALGDLAGGLPLPAGFNDSLMQMLQGGNPDDDACRS